MAHFFEVLGSTQPLTEMRTGNISWGGRVKAAGASGRQTYHLHVLIILKSRSLNLPEIPGPLQGFCTPFL
jgi:hypothetical protein